MDITNTSAQAYLEIDKNSYDALIKRLVTEVKSKNTNYPESSEAALRNYFAVALTKGSNFSGIKFDDLAQMDPVSLSKAAEELPDKVSLDSRKIFAEAANARAPYMNWDKLFPNGGNEITLPLSAQAQSVNDRIAAYIDNHNRQSAAKFAEASITDPKNAGKAIGQQEIRLDPNDPSKLQVINPNKPVNEDGSKRWQPGPRLGAFLESNKEWALLNDFALENSRKNNAASGTGGKKADTHELLKHASPSSDKYDPDSLRIIISRDPQKIGEMSSSQHWSSCMAENGINFHYVPKDIEAGSLVAYLVSKDDPQARYPLMRQLIKPYNNQAGEIVMIPAKIYGADMGGNSRTRQALHDTLSHFVRENVNAGKAGEFIMDNRLYGDGQPGFVNLETVWDKGSIEKGLIKYHDSSLKEDITEWAIREEKAIKLQREIDGKKKYSKPGSHSPFQQEIETTEKELAKVNNEIKSLQGKINNLGNPEALAKGFYRETRKTSHGSLPMPQMILEVSNNPEIAARHTAINAAVMGGDTGPLSKYLATRPLSERIETAATVAQFATSSGYVFDNKAAVKLWKEYTQSLSSPEERIAEARKIISYGDFSTGLKKAGAKIILEDMNQVKTPQERLKLVEFIIDYEAIDSLRFSQIIAGDINGLSNPRERIDTATTALKAASYDNYSPEAAATKVNIVNMAHTDMEALPKAQARIDFATKIISLQDTLLGLSADANVNINADTMQHAKRVIVQDIPALQKYRSDLEEVKKIISSAAYHDDKTFASEVTNALKQQKSIENIGIKFEENINKVATDAQQEALIKEWAKQIRDIPDAEWRLSAVNKAIEVAKAAKSQFDEGKTSPLKAFETEAAKILLEDIPKLPQGVLQAEAYSSAIGMIHDPAMKDQVQNKLMGILLNKTNNMQSHERLWAAFTISGHPEEGLNLNRLSRPINHQVAELILNSSEFISDNSARAHMAAIASIQANPGSDLEFKAVSQFRESIGKLPADARRPATYGAIQIVNMIRNHPQNIIVERHGELLICKARDLI